MKKLLIALLTLTLIFTSCTTQTKKSSLNQYAQSQQALDFVKRVATYLAGINFSKIDLSEIPSNPYKYTQDEPLPVRLTSAVYPQLCEIAFSQSKDGNYIEVETKKAVNVLEKYFGENAIPKSFQLDESLVKIYLSALLYGSNIEIKSVVLSDFVDNTAEYTVNFNYISGSSKFDYVSKMKFRVIDQNGETYLQLLSNVCTPTDMPEYSLEEKAKALSKVLFNTLGSNGLYNLEKDTVSPNDYNNHKLNWFFELLIESTCEKTISRYSFDSKCPYYRALDADIHEEWYHFPIEKINQIVYEVFGRTDFEFETSEYFHYNKENNEYVQFIEFGAYADVREEITVSTLQDGTILSEVTCQFYTDETYTYYTERTFSLKLKPMQNENGETFLRLI